MCVGFSLITLQPNLVVIFSFENDRTPSLEASVNTERAPEKCEGALEKN